MTFARALEVVAARRKTLTVYAGKNTGDVLAEFEIRNASIEHRRLPGDDPAGFVVIREADGFVGSIGLDELDELLEPPVCLPWNWGTLAPEYRALYELLENALFASLDRRQLLAAAREIENRAWRVEEGTLRVGFQRVSALEEQIPVYARLGSETDLETHVYVRTELDPPELANVTVHSTTGGEIGDYWFLTLRSGDVEQRCALLAEQRAENQYYGFWTYDPDLVDEIDTYVRETYD